MSLRWHFTDIARGKLGSRCVTKWASKDTLTHMTQEVHDRGWWCEKHKNSKTKGDCERLPERTKKQICFFIFCSYVFRPSPPLHYTATENNQWILLCMSPAHARLLRLQTQSHAVLYTHQSPTPSRFFLLLPPSLSPPPHLAHPKTDLSLPQLDTTRPRT